MERREVSTFLENIDVDRSLDDLVNYLVERKSFYARTRPEVSKLHTEHYEDYEYYGNESTRRVGLFGYRLETDDEFNKRQQQDAQQKEWRRQQFEALQKEFGKSNT